MKNPNRIYSSVKPEYIQKLGNNTYYYNYDITESLVASPETGEPIFVYDYIQIYQRGIPDYKVCIQAIIRQFVSAEDEFSLMNKYNRYLIGIEEDANVYNEYLDYLTKVSEISSKVKADFKITPEEISTKSELIPSLHDIINLTKILIQTTELSDSQALSCKSLYDSWESYINKSLESGTKITYNGKLFKVRQKINKVLNNQPPSITTAALYEEIVEISAGTQEDPIPYNGNMELFEGKYYIQNGIIYKCIRNSGQPLYHELSALVGNYVQKV